LSFGAVALLFYMASGRLGEEHWLAAWAHAQWAVTIGMVPALLALFQQFSLVSPLANAVAIPVVSLVVTPLALLGALPLGDPLLWLAHGVMAAVMALLDWLATSSWAVWQQAVPPAWTVALGVAGVGWLLLPQGFPRRWLGAVALLPLVLVAPPRPGPGEATATVLDVGQGLAVHVQTAGHDLLYDAGPAFSADADSGNRIIVPYLRSLGVGKLDTLVISHADKDHEGGAESVARGVATALLLSSLPDEHPLVALLPSHRRCRDGDEWQWDGVRFQVLHPMPEDYDRNGISGNDLSCVVKVTTAGGAILLTGDISARSEAALLSRHGDDLPVEVIVPAHHGSRSSSSEVFVAAVSPRQAVFSSGYRNRFGHPATEVTERYLAAGSQPWRTDRQGAVLIELRRRGATVTAEIDRQRRYWHQR
jgi:competence protein ComEC